MDIEILETRFVSKHLKFGVSRLGSPSADEQQYRSSKIRAHLCSGSSFGIFVSLTGMWQDP